MSKIDCNETKEYWGDHFFLFKENPIISFCQKGIRKVFQIIRKNILIIDSIYPFGLSGYVRNIHKTYNFDCVIINYVWLSRLFKTVNIPQKAIFTHDVFSNRNLRTGSNWYSLTFSQEAKALKRCPYILSIQKNEAVFFSYLSPQSKILTVYSPVKYIELPVVNNNNIIFLASDNKHNIEGINYFISAIFPKLIAVFPDIKLLIGGSICGMLQNLPLVNSKHIECVGLVNDIRTFYEKGNIVINPVFNGTGLKIKTFEAISFGKFIIAHPHSLDGVFDDTPPPIFTASGVEDYIKWLTICFKNKDIFIQNKLKCQSYIADYNFYITQQYKKIVEP
jgi:hypothetical protein